MFKKIQKILHLKKSRTRHKYAHTITNPDRDWGVILLIFVAVSAIIAVFSANIFLGINNKDLFAVETKEIQEIKSIDGGLLSKTLGLFEERLENFENLQQSPPRIPRIR